MGWAAFRVIGLMKILSNFVFTNFFGSISESASSKVFDNSPIEKPQKNLWKMVYTPLRKKCPYSELFWSAFSRIVTEYGEIHLPVFSQNAEKCGSE